MRLAVVLRRALGVGEVAADFVPLLVVHREVETGKHHKTIGQPRNTMQQPADHRRSRDHAGRDDQVGRRLRLEAGDPGAHQVVAAERAIDLALLGEDPWPAVDNDR